MKKKLDFSELSDEDILKERSNLLDEYNKSQARSKEVVSKLHRLKSELRKRRGDRDKPFVSDHAVIRYLERVEGLDIEAVRDFLLNKIPIDAEINEHNSIILKDFVLKLSKDRKAITTVITKEMMDEGAIQAKCPSGSN